MDIEDFKELLRNGVEKWNDWRKSNPNYQIRLSGPLPTPYSDYNNINFEGVHFDNCFLTNTILQYANLNNSKFRHCDLKYNDFTGSSMNNMQMTDCKITKGVFKYTSGSNSDLTNSFIEEGNFDHCNFEQFVFGNTYLKKSSFIKSKLNDCRFIKSEIENSNLSLAFAENTSFRKSIFNYSAFEDANLDKVYIVDSEFKNTVWNDVSMKCAFITRCDFERANLSGLVLCETEISDSKCWQTDFSNCNLKNANLSFSSLSEAKMVNANLSNCDLNGTDLNGTDLTSSILRGARLTRSSMVSTILKNAILDNARVFGVNVWSIEGPIKSQNNLEVFEDGPNLTVDEIEISQFIHLLVENSKIRNVINTISTKTVVILGRFSRQGKEIIDVLKGCIRSNELIPIVFDFERSSNRDFTETLKTITGLSRFVIADISDPKSIPLELQAIVPNFMVPIVPLIRNDQEPFSMFVDLQRKYGTWLLDLIEYSSSKQLKDNFNTVILGKVIEVEKTLSNLKKINSIKKIQLK